MLEIEQILEQTSYGATKPLIIIANNKKKYVLKFRNSSDFEEEKDLHIFNEYLGYKLKDLLKFNISPQSLEFIIIDRESIELAENSCKKKNITYEALNYMKKSLGTNIAIEYIENAEKVSINEAFRNKFISETMNLDNYILNNDRIKENPNILKDLNLKNKYYVIDFGLAFLDNRIYDAISNNNFEFYRMCVQSCNTFKNSRYIFKDIEQNIIKSGILDIKSVIQDIVNSCPIEWEVNQYKEEIIEILTSRIDSKFIFGNESCPVELY